MRLKYFISESINDKSIMKAIIVGGLSASGKTTIVKSILIDQQKLPIKYLNTDKATEVLDPRNQQWSKFKGKIKKITNNDFRLTMNSLLPVYVDSTSTNLSAVKKRVQLLQDIGYECAFIFVKTSKRTSIKRSIGRFQGGGREVEPDFIRDINDKFYCQGKYKDECTSGLEQAQSIFDKVYVVDNNYALDDFESINKDIHKSVMKFFTSPISNPKGKKLIDYMRKMGYKYYNDVPKEWMDANGYPELKDITYI